MAFKLNLRGRSDIAKSYVQAALRRKKHEKEILDQWIAEQPQFERERILGLWEQYRTELGQQFIQIVVQAYGTSNAVLDTNQAMRSHLNIEDPLDAQMIYGLLGKLSVLQIYNMLLQQTSLPQEICIGVLNRMVDRQFPLKKATVPGTITQLKQHIEKITEPDEPTDNMQ